MAGKLDFEQKSFFVVYVGDIFSALEIYSARITLSGIYYQNQGANEKAELRGPLSVIRTFEELRIQEAIAEWICRLL